MATPDTQVRLGERNSRGSYFPKLSPCVPRGWAEPWRLSCRHRISSAVCLPCLKRYCTYIQMDSWSSSSAIAYPNYYMQLTVTIIHYSALESHAVIIIESAPSVYVGPRQTSLTRSPPRTVSFVGFASPRLASSCLQARYCDSDGITA